MNNYSPAKTSTSRSVMKAMNNQINRSTNVHDQSNCIRLNPLEGLYTVANIKSCPPGDTLAN